MDLTSLLIGLGGILLGAFTTYLAYLQRKDDRTAQYREALYTKQIEASIEIMAIATEHLQNVRNIIEGKVTMDKLSESINKALESKERLGKIYYKWEVFMPVQLHRALKSFIKKTYDVLHSVSSWENNDFNEERLSKYQSEIRETYYSLVEEARKTIGTDPLSTETVKLFANQVKN